MQTKNEAVIVGTGFAGLGMAIHLKKAGIDDFVILEQAESVGGTWRDNHYPGCACDVESHLYSFSFEQNPKWSRMFAPWNEIRDYLEHCAEHYDLERHIRFRSTVKRAAFSERTGRWQVQVGDDDVYDCRWLVAATGGLSRPKLPDIEGLDTFAGKAFHSARWDSDYRLAGKRVGVIGTGASAIQIVPGIAHEVGRMEVFQRTPPWILPRRDRAIGSTEQALYERVPALQTAYRAAIYARRELFKLTFDRDSRIGDFAEKMARKHLRDSVADPILRKQLTPEYQIGCKRILLSNDYYPALQLPHVSLVTTGIERVVPEGIITKDGKLHELDALVLATGFMAADAEAPFEVRGRGGADLTDEWRPGARAYLGTTVHGFPNLFVLVGPNSGLGHSSMVHIIESQIAYVMSAVGQLRGMQNAPYFDVRGPVLDRYNQALQARLKNRVWSTGGCQSWYQTPSGMNTTLFPGFTFEFRLRTRHFRLDDYELVPVHAPVPLSVTSGSEVGPAPSRA
ncbi:MAG: NAD(P)/FAD-dependent oxidoreductase [Polyangiaceae bacterium]